MDPCTEFFGADHLGAKGWMCAMKRNHRRSGPSAIPSPGLPCMIMALDNMVIHIFPCQNLCSAGIPLSSYETYISTPEGGRDAKAAGLTIAIPAGAVFFVPPGHLSFLVHYKTLENSVLHMRTLIVARCSLFLTS